MGWYRKSSGLIFDALRRYYTSKLTALVKTPIQESFSSFRTSPIGLRFRESRTSEISKPFPRKFLNQFQDSNSGHFQISSLRCGFSKSFFPAYWQLIFRKSFDSFQLSRSRTLFHSCIPRPSVGTSSISGISQPILRNAALHNGLKQNQWKIPFQNGAKRFYYVDRRQIYHFRPRGYKQWFQNPRNTFIVILVGGGVVVTVYYGNLETVPYTKRTHFVLLSSSLERELGERQFQQMKAGFKGKILPPLHPDSIRIQRISQEIIQALQKGLRKEQVWSDFRYSPESIGLPHEAHVPETMSALSDRIVEEEKWNSEDKWNREDEILDDRWVQQSRKKGQEKGMKSQTSHLEGLKWEVIVVNEPVVNAFCLPGGKIVVFTGLLNHFKADAEIATIIGHEVGHAVARHSAEQISKNLWLTILQLILYQFFMPDVVNTMSNLLLRLPFSRRMEMEADYIGLLLTASAGYDPRVAPQVYEKLGRITGDSKLQDYLATHPSGRKRAELLAQAKVMEEAFNIYREEQTGRGIEGFL